MAEDAPIVGRAAALRVENLDTDQIMPKQFLRGIDKSGLERGLLHDLRFDTAGRPRPDFVLNRPAYAGTSILIGGANFGCGSSREHAVWGLLQYGIRAVVAPSFGEIFFSNAMNNRLLLIALPDPVVRALMDEADAGGPSVVRLDVARSTLASAQVSASFELSARHRRMFTEGLDVIGLSLTHREAVEAFARRWHARHPWLAHVGRTVRDRLDAGAEPPP